MSVRADGKMTRARIRAAGLVVVLEKGWPGLTFKAVAGELPDVSWQTVKHHFKTMGGLQAEVYKHMAECQANRQFKSQNPEKMKPLKARMGEYHALEVAA